MSTEANNQGNKEPKKDAGIDFEKLAASIDEKIKGRFDGLSKKLDEKLPSKKEEEFKWPHEIDQDDEDAPVTKGQLKSSLEGIVTKLLEKSEKNSFDITNQLLSQRENRLQRDSEAITKFPMLNPKSESYDKDFEGEVEKEIDKRIKRGRSRDDIDLLYDAAASVKATNVKFSRAIEEKISDENRRYNNQESQFGVRGKSSQNSGKPTDAQIELANKFGMSKDNLEKYMKRSKEN